MTEADTTFVDGIPTLESESKKHKANARGGGQPQIEMIRIRHIMEYFKCSRAGTFCFVQPAEPSNSTRMPSKAGSTCGGSLARSCP